MYLVLCIKMSETGKQFLARNMILGGGRKGDGERMGGRRRGEAVNVLGEVAREQPLEHLDWSKHAVDSSMNSSTSGQKTAPNPAVLHLGS